MNSAQSTVEAVAYAALAEGVTLAPVYQHVPQDTARPLVIIGDIELDAFGGKGDDDDERGTLEVVSLFEGEERKPLLAMQAEAKEALHELRVTRDGWTIAITYAGATATLSEDSAEYVGLSRFNVIALKD